MTPVQSELPPFSPGILLSASVRLLCALCRAALLADQRELPGSGRPGWPGQRTGLHLGVSLPSQLTSTLTQQEASPSVTLDRGLSEEQEGFGIRRLEMSRFEFSRCFHFTTETSMCSFTGSSLFNGSWFHSPDGDPKKRTYNVPAVLTLVWGRPPCC